MYNLTWEWTWSAYCMSVVKCESGDGNGAEMCPIRRGLSRLSNTGSGEPTSCALVAATNELLPNGPQRAHLQISWTEIRAGWPDVLYFAKLIGVPLVYKLQLIGVNFLHDCMEKLNVNLSGSKAIVVTIIVKRSLPVLPCPVEIQMRRQVIQVTVSLVQRTSYWRSIPS